jgi:hypothetical protein
MTVSIDRHYPLPEALGLIGLRTTKAYEEIAAGRLRVVRNGRRTFVRASEIERYFDSLDGKAA